jgi:hypothetical protein
MRDIGLQFSVLVISLVIGIIVMLALFRELLLKNATKSWFLKR